MAGKEGSKAWIIRWEWDGDHAAVKDRFIVALPSRLGGKSIRTFVERYYASQFLSQSEQLHCMVRKRSPKPVSSTIRGGRLEGQGLQYQERPLDRPSHMR